MVPFQKQPQGLKACNIIKKRLQHRCFPVKYAKFLRTPILKNICERLSLLFPLGFPVSFKVTKAEKYIVMFNILNVLNNSLTNQSHNGWKCRFLKNSFFLKYFQFVKRPELLTKRNAFVKGMKKIFSVIEVNVDTPLPLTFSLLTFYRNYKDI